MPHQTAKNVAADSGDNVDEQIARRSVKLFDLRANVHEHPHIEEDVQNAAVEKNGGDEPPGLDCVDGPGQRGAHAQQDLAVDAAKIQEAGQAAATRLKAGLAHCLEQTDQEQQAAHRKNGVRNRRSLRQVASERLAGGGHGKSHARATIVAARGACADQRAAGWAELRPRLLAFAGGGSGKLFEEFLDFPACARRQGQMAFLAVM